MRLSAISFAGLVTLVGVGCTTIIGLPDLPDPASAGGNTTTSGAASTDQPGDGGSPTAGEPSGGKSQGGRSGNTNGGSVSGGNATTGGSTIGGSSTGGTDQGGAPGTDECSPKCVTGASCIEGVCTCPKDQTECVDGCVDLRSDKDHCNTCTSKCDSACSAGRCYTRLVTVPFDRTQMAVNATHVYFTQENAGTVSRVPRGGGAVQVLAQSQKSATTIALDKTNVYWINNSYYEPKIQQLPLAGGTSPKTVASTSNLDLYGLAVDATYVYWTQDGLDASVVKAPLAGGEPVTLAPSDWNARELAIDDTSVYWVVMGGDDNTGSVKKVAKTGGTVATLATGINYPAALTLYGGSLYFANADSIRKVSTSGGAVSIVSSTTGGNVVAVGPSDIFSGSAGGNRTLLQLSLAGATKATLSEGVQIFSIAVDGTSVFWSDSVGIGATTKAP